MSKLGPIEKMYTQQISTSEMVEVVCPHGIVNAENPENNVKFPVVLQTLAIQAKQCFEAQKMNG